MKGQVVSLHLGLGSGLPKPRVEALELVAGFGAKGDRHAGKDPDRAVLVAGLSAYEKAQGAGIPLPYGAPRGKPPPGPGPPRPSPGGAA